MPRLFNIRQFQGEILKALPLTNSRKICGEKEIADDTLEIVQSAINDSRLEDAAISMVVVALILGILLLTMRFGLWTRMKNRMG